MFYQFFVEGRVAQLVAYLGYITIQFMFIQNVGKFY